MLPHHYLEKYAKETPDKLAVIYPTQEGEQTLTYSELNERANQLAHYLYKNFSSKLGRQNVCVYLNRSIDNVICLFAIWKAGLIYMPLAVTDQSTDIISRLEKSNTSIIITQKTVSCKLTFNQENFKVIQLEDIKMFEKASSENLSLGQNETDWAYICCSSGTTDEPKIIINRFEGLEGRIQGHATLMDIKAESCILNFAAFDFDASLMECLLAIYKGATLYIAPDSVRKNAYTELPQLFKKAKLKPITDAILTPSILRGPSSEGLNSDDFPSLRAIVTMGEECHENWLLPWFKKKNVKLLSGYGPTETTIAATLMLIEPNKPIPITQALPGVTLYLVSMDEQQFPSSIFYLYNQNIANPVSANFFLGAASFSMNYPLFQRKFLTKDKKIIATIEKNTNVQELPDCGGEIYIGGKGIGKYLLCSAKNALRFIDNDVQFNYQPVFRTGDLARLTKGELFFAGRIDRQIKRNGELVTLDEIERELQKCSAIDKAVVIASGRQVIAYLTKKNITLSNENINENISEELFTHISTLLNKFRPNFCFQVTALPTNTRGKLSHSIQDFEKPVLLLAKNSIMCKGENQLKLADIWHQMLFEEETKHFLKADMLPASINFFELGGDSLRFSAMLAQLWIKFNLKNDEQPYAPLEFSDMIKRNPTIANIVKVIINYQPADCEQISAGQYPAFFCINTDYQANELLSYLKYYANLPAIYALVPKVNKKESQVLNKETAITQILLALRKKQPTGPYHIGGSKEDGELAISVAEHLIKQGEEVYVSFLKLDNALLNNLPPFVILFNNQNLAELPDYIKAVYINQLDITIKQKLKQHYCKLAEQLNKISEHDKLNSDKFTYPPCSVLPVLTKPITVIVGPAGSGKTWLAYNLQQKLKEKISLTLEQESSITVNMNLAINDKIQVDLVSNETIKPKLLEPFIWYLPLQGLQQKNCFMTALQKAGFTSDEIALLKTKPAIFIGDGYTEMARHDFANLWQANFADWEQAKLILTARNGYIYQGLKNSWPESDYGIYEVPSIDKPIDNIESYLQEWLKYTGKSAVEFNDFLNFVKQVYKFVYHDSCKDKPKEITLQFWPSRWENPTLKITEAHNLQTHPYFNLLCSLLVQASSQCLRFPKWLEDYLANKIKQNELSISSQHTDMVDSLPITELKLTEPLSSAESKSVAPLQWGNYRKPIFAFHALTGDIPEAYRRIAKSLNPNQPFYVLFMQEPGLVNTRDRSACMKEKAEYFIAIMKKIQPEGPYFLLGWSFGALLAHQVAVLLEQAGDKVALIINIDCPSPTEIAKYDPVERCIPMITKLSKIYNVDVCKVEEKIRKLQLSQLKPPEQIDKAFNVIIEDLTQNQISNNQKAIQRFITILKNTCINLKAGYAYAKEPPVKIQAPCFIAEAEKPTEGINQQTISTKEIYCASARKSWDEWLSIAPIVETFPGDHFTIFAKDKFTTAIRNQLEAKQTLIPLLPLSTRIQIYLKNLMSKKKDIFIPLQSRLYDHDDKPVALMDRIQQFLASSTPRLLILGNPGTGKTRSVQELTQVFAHHYQQGGWLPIYIKLAANLNECITQALYEVGFTDEEIKQRLAKLKLLFILDGCDEINLKEKLYTLNQLQGWAHSKVIYTCRTEKEREYASYFSESANKLETIYLLPFNNQQMIDYINAYKKHFQLKNDQDFLKKINQYSGLNELVKNPLLLFMVMQVLSSQAFDALSPVPDTELTRTDIYAAFMQQHYKAIKAYLEESQGIAAGTDIEKAFTNYSQQLAYNILIFGKTFSDKDIFLANDRDTQQARRASFTSLKGNQLSFDHETHMEYLVAAYIAEELQTSPSTSLSKKLLVNHRSLLDFLIDKLKKFHKDNYVAKLMKIISHTRKDKTSAAVTAASNAITILNFARVPLSGMDLSGIAIKEARLDEAFLHATNLSNSDLTGVVLSNAYLEETNFSGCNMNNVKFGIHPDLKLDDYVDYIFHISNKIVCLQEIIFSDLFIYNFDTYESLNKEHPDYEQIHSKLYSQINNDKALKGNIFIADSGLQKEVVNKQKTLTAKIVKLKPKPNNTSTLTLSEFLESKNLKREKIIVSNFSKKKCLYTFVIPIGKSHSNGTSVLFSPNGKILLGIPKSTNKIFIWSMDTGMRLTLTGLGEGEYIKAVKFSNDSSLLVAHTNLKKIVVWYTQTGENIGTSNSSIKSSHLSSSLMLEFSDNNKYLVVAEPEKKVLFQSCHVNNDIYYLEIFEILQNRILRRVSFSTNPIKDICFSKDSQTLFILYGGLISFLDLSFDKFNFIDQDIALEKITEFHTTKIAKKSWWYRPGESLTLVLRRLDSYASPISIKVSSYLSRYHFALFCYDNKSYKKLIHEWEGYEIQIDCFSKTCISSDLKYIVCTYDGYTVQLINISKNIGLSKNNSQEFFRKEKGKLSEINFGKKSEYLILLTTDAELEIISVKTCKLMFSDTHISSVYVINEGNHLEIWHFDSKGIAKILDLNTFEFLSSPIQAQDIKNYDLVIERENLVVEREIRNLSNTIRINYSDMRAEIYENEKYIGYLSFNQIKRIYFKNDDEIVINRNIYFIGNNRLLLGGKFGYSPLFFKNTEFNEVKNLSDKNKMLLEDYGVFKKTRSPTKLEVANAELVELQQFEMCKEKNSFDKLNVIEIG